MSQVKQLGDGVQSKLQPSKTDSRPWLEMNKVHNEIKQLGDGVQSKLRPSKTDSRPWSEMNKVHNEIKQLGDGVQSKLRPHVRRVIERFNNMSKEPGSPESWSSYSASDVRQHRFVPQFAEKLAQAKWNAADDNKIHEEFMKWKKEKQKKES